MSAATERVLIKGNEAVAFGAIDAGCRCYFGYPITPQNEVPESLSSLLPEVGGQFVQAESEVGAINMVLGAGDIGPSQGDYFQAVKGGGHGDHRNLVLAPSTAQECYDFMFRAFALAFKYANPVMVLGDAIVGQIKEPVRRVPPKDAVPAEDLAALAAPWRMEGYGRRGPGAQPRLLKSVYLAEGALAERNRMLMRKYESMKADCAFECVDTDDAELIVVAFGSIARIARSAIRQLRAQGHKIGLFRPITLFPFPDEALRALAPGRRFLVMEQNTGQMVEDVRLALFGQPGVAPASVLWHGVMPGLFIGADALREPMLQALKEN